MLNLNLNWVSETIKTIKDWWPVVKSNFQQIQNNYNSHISGTSDKHLAEHITYSGVVSGASNVKQGIDNIKNSYNGHVNGESDKHAAEHITFASNRLTLPDDNVKNAIETIDMRIEQIIQEQSLDPNKDVEVVSSRVSAIYGEFDTLPERLDNTDNIVNDLNAKIDAPDYSAPQETIASVISLPSSVVEGQFSDVVLKGNTRINYINNSNMDKDSDGNGFVDGFNFFGVSQSVTATFSFDAGNKAQKIEITDSTGTGVANTVHSNFISVTPGEIVSYSVEAKAQVNSGSFRGTVMLVLYDANKNAIGTTSSKSFTNSEFTTIFYNNITIPNGVAYIHLRLSAEALAAGDKGVVWYRNALLEKAASVGNYISSGVKSTESVRVRSINKNFFDIDYMIGKKQSSGGTITIDEDKFTISHNSTWGYVTTARLKLLPNTQYTFSVFRTILSGSNPYAGYVVIFDSSSSPLGYIYAGSGKASVTFTTTDGEIFMNFYSALEDGTACTVEFSEIQLEEGTTATEWEESKNGGEAYIDNVGNSLLNGVYDEYNVITGIKTQRTKTTQLNGSHVTQLLTSLSNVDVVYLNKPTDSVGYNNMSKIGWATLTGFTEFISGSINLVENIGKFRTVGSASSFEIAVAKGTFANLAAAQTYYNNNPISLIYQLATPITHEGTGQGLTSYPNGHIIVEPVVKVTKPYNNGITVDKPIQAIESITKVEDGVRTPVDVTKATVASDKLSLTITGASDNEIYEIIYQYPSELTTLPTIRYRYPLNTAAAIEANTKASAANSKAINDFIAYQNAVNLQFDLRLVALEP